MSKGLAYKAYLDFKTQTKEEVEEGAGGRSIYPRH